MVVAQKQKQASLRKQAKRNARRYDNDTRLNKWAIYLDFGIPPSTLFGRQENGWPGLKGQKKQTLDVEQRQFQNGVHGIGREDTYLKAQVAQAIKPTYPFATSDGGEWKDSRTYFDRKRVLWRTVRGGAETHGCNPQTVWDWIDSGRLVPLRATWPESKRGSRIVPSMISSSCPST